VSPFDLPRPARILAVADVFDALTADRPYRAAMPVEQALAIVREDAGRALCPAAVAGLEASLAGEPAFTATLSTNLGDHEGLRPPVRRPA
jgi:HD-GYP domain-containing protein (c-di-GMP phosphodiesterase class II)